MKKSHCLVEWKSENKNLIMKSLVENISSETKNTAASGNVNVNVNRGFI